MTGGRLESRQDPCKEAHNHLTNSKGSNMPALTCRYTRLHIIILQRNGVWGLSQRKTDLGQQEENDRGGQPGAAAVSSDHELAGAVLVQSPAPRGQPPSRAPRERAVGLLGHMAGSSQQAPPSFLWPACVGMALPATCTELTLVCFFSVA